MLSGIAVPAASIRSVLHVAVKRRSSTDSNLEGSILVKQSTEQRFPCLMMGLLPAVLKYHWGITFMAVDFTAVGNKRHFLGPAHIFVANWKERDYISFNSSFPAANPLLCFPLTKTTKKKHTHSFWFYARFAELSSEASQASVCKR